MDNLRGDTERSVLLACVKTQHARNVALETLEPTAFSVSANKKFFQAVASLEKTEAPVTVVSLQNELQKMGSWDETGWAYITGLFGDSVTDSGIEYNCQLLKDLSEKQEFEKLLLTSLSDVKNPMKDWKDTMGGLQINSARLGETAVPQNPLAEYNEAYEDVLLGRVRPYVSGFADLDALSGGWDKEWLVTVSGRTAMGKSSFAVSIAERFLQLEHRVLFFSMEMSGKETKTRFLRLRANFGEREIRQVQNDATRRKEWLDALASFEGRRAEIVDGRHPTAQIFAKAKRFFGTDGGVMLVDHLLKIPYVGKADNQAVRVGEHAAELKNIAQRLKILVVCLHQISRGFASRQNKRPTLEDLRDSGVVEQESDQVLFLHRPWEYERKRDNYGKAEFILDKNRHGKTGAVPVAWLHEKGWYENADRT